MKQKIPLPDTIEQTFSLKNSKDIILFGAGLFVQPAIHALKKLGKTIACICDNSIVKHGTAVWEIPIISPHEAIEKYTGALVIITAAPKYIEEITSQSLELGWENIYDCSNLLASFEYNRNTFFNGISKTHFDLDRYFNEYFLKYYPEKLVIPSIDVIITERCSLKCRDCSNLMQYYVDPQNLEFKEVFEALDILMESVDHVVEFRVLGGETFMNKDAYKFINRLREYKNKTRIAVYSNGTIIPKGHNLDCLIHDDTYLRISNYGTLSKNIDNMVKIFDEFGIEYDVENCDAWQDCSTISKMEKSVEELEAMYSDCCVKNYLTLLKGNLYNCPYAANASNLGALPKFPGEYIALNKKQDKSKIRERIKILLREKTYFSACKYCGGRSLDDMLLPAAIQTKETLSFRKYSIIVK